MINVLAPYIHIAGMLVCILIVGTTALMAATADSDIHRPAGLALTGALLTWSATLYVALNPFPALWFRALALSMWVLLSGISAMLLWVCRPPKPEPPAAPPAPPPVYPKINGQWKSPSAIDTIEADQLRRTYRRKA